MNSKAINVWLQLFDERAKQALYTHRRARAQILKQHKSLTLLSNWSNICSKISMTNDYFSAFGSSQEVFQRQIELANMQFNGYFATTVDARWRNRASEVSTPVNHSGSILNYTSHYKRMSAGPLTPYRTFLEPLKRRIKFLEKCNS